MTDCPRCNGQGDVQRSTPSRLSRRVRYDDLTPDDYCHPCPDCDGTGRINEATQTPTDRMNQIAKRQIDHMLRSGARGETLRLAWQALAETVKEAREEKVS